MINFALDVHQNRYLPPECTDIDAVLTVNAVADLSAVPPALNLAVVIMIDCSGSMGHPVAKIFAAKRAASAAIDSLRDGTYFAVIAGTETATPIYPRSGLATVSPTTRREAKAAISGPTARGGTAMSSWLALTNQLLREHSTAVRYAILLTDGQNAGEPRERLVATLRDCEGNFRCDCRGIGEDWVAEDLYMIADALLGTARDVPKPADLVDDFLEMAREATSKVVGEVRLRVWVPYGARIRVFKQVYPTIQDLTDHVLPVDGQTSDFPVAAWGSEKRDYHLAISGLDPVLEESPSWACRVDVVYGGEERASAPVLAQWTEDTLLFTQVSRAVEESSGQLELALAIQLGAAALRTGDTRSAESKLGEAVRLAHEAGNQAKLDVLARLVDVIDPAAGSVRIRADLQDRDVEVADLRSVWTRGIER